MKNFHADDMFTCGSERKCVVKTDQLWDEVCSIWDSSTKTDRTSKAVLWSHTGIGPRIAEKGTSVEHTTFYELAISLSRHRLEIDRNIGLPIFFPIFKHFTIIAYRFWEKITDIYIYIFFLISHIHNYTEYNQQWNVLSAFDPSKCTHTWSSGHTHTHTHTPGAVDTVHSGEAPARPPHVTLYKIHLFETR